MLRAECKSQAEAWLCIFKQKEEFVNASCCFKTVLIVAQFGNVKMKVAHFACAAPSCSVEMHMCSSSETTVGTYDLGVNPSTIRTDQK